MSEFFACMSYLLIGGYWLYSGEFPQNILSENFLLIFFWNSFRKVFRNSNMTENLASFSIHKIFNLILNQVSLRKALNFRSFRIFCLHVLSTKWGALVVIGWIPTKHSFGKFHIDINSKFVEESLEIQLCHKILPLFPFTNFQSIFK